MTQEVQPLTWQKRTNIEEHQQFFSKINEIIDNLAPTVDEAEAAIAQATAAIAQATAAIASANDAIATANAASAAASAAASQAQTAASTVAGYDTRLTAAEGDIDALQAADQTITGNVAALGTRVTAAESKNSQQDTAIGALQTADGQNVKINAINQYAVGLTGAQSPIAGSKTFISPLTINSDGVSIPFFVKSRGNARMMQLTAKDYDVTDGVQHFLPSVLAFNDQNEVTMFRIGAYSFSNGRVQIKIFARNSDGTYKEATLIEGDTIA